MVDVSPRRDAYPSCDAFFTRALRPGAREISQARVVAPADGRLVAVGRIEKGAQFRVKAQDYAAHELIGEPADEYVGGISGDLYPVNTLGERHVPTLAHVGGSVRYGQKLLE